MAKIYQFSRYDAKVRQAARNFKVEVKKLKLSIVNDEL